MSYRKMDKYGSPQYCRHFLADNSIFHGRFMSVWWIYRNVPLLYRTIQELRILHFSKSQEMWRVVFDYLTIRCIWDWYTQGGAVTHIMMIIKRWYWIVWGLPSSVLKGKEISPSWLDAVCLNGTVSPRPHRWAQNWQLDRNILQIATDSLKVKEFVQPCRMQIGDGGKGGSIDRCAKSQAIHSYY